MEGSKINLDLVDMAAETGFIIDDTSLRRYLKVHNGKLEHRGKRTAALVRDTAEFRLKIGMGRRPRRDLICAAESQQVYVNGFDRSGRAIVIYYPTVDAACPIEQSVVFLCCKNNTCKKNGSLTYGY